MPTPLRDLTDTQILDLLDQATGASEGPIERGVLAAFRQLRSSLTAESLERALQTGALEAWLQSEPWRTMSESLLELWSGEDAPVSITHERAARAALGQVPVDLGDLVDATTLSARAANWAERHGASLVQDITESAREGIRTLVDWANRVPDLAAAPSVHRSSPLERALLALKDSNGELRLGLDARRARTYANRLAQLEAQHAAGEITLRKLRQQAQRKYAQLRKARAKLIARTESSFAGNNGLLDGWRVAANTGELSIEGLGGQFRSETETAVAPPLHPGCYCALRLVLVDGVYRIEWVTRVINVCPRCQAMDGLLMAA